MSRVRGGRWYRPEDTLWMTAVLIVLLVAGTLAGAAVPAPAPAAPAAPAVARAPEPHELVVYAAASLRDALEALAGPCERELGLRPVLVFGASGDLARQIVAAAKADVFLSADEAWMDAVDAKGLVDRGSRRSLLSNALVVVAPLDSTLRLDGPRALATAAIRRLSLADPAVVPAGRYARAWLEASGQWDALRERVVPALDVRAALAAVESGAADAGIVYRSDARISRRVRVVLAVPASEGPAISYPVAAIAGRPALDDARRFVAWLATPAAAAVFRDLGFTVRADGAGP